MDLIVLPIAQMFAIIIVTFCLFLQLIVDMFLKMKLIINCQRLKYVESIGVNSNELKIYQNFENYLEVTGERYSVKLLFKLMTEPVPHNFITSKKRLSNLKHKLDCNQKLKEQYNNILKDK